MRRLFLVLILIAAIVGVAGAQMKFSGSVVPYIYLPSLDGNQMYFELTPTLNLALDKTWSVILAGDTTFDLAGLGKLDQGLTKALKSGYIYTGGKADFGFVDFYAHVGSYYDGLLYWDLLSNFKAIPNVTLTVEYVGADAANAKGTLEAWASISF